MEWNAITMNTATQDAIETPTQQHKSRITIFTDLDDTLIQTQGKLPEMAKTALGATDREGMPLSYFTEAQQNLLGMFQQAKATIIPVTGRNTDALNRVLWHFNHYKIVSHGAVVLDGQNQVCSAWLNSIDTELEEWPDLLHRANAEINRIINTFKLDARSRVIIDKDIPAYVSIKGKADALACIRRENPLDPKFYRHENGRNHALLPPYTRKKRAVEHVMSHLGLAENDLTIGLGDSLTDLAFMQSCHFSMIPTRSQIVEEKLQHA